MDYILPIALGLLFGFALNRAGATNPQNIINMLRLTDLRLMRAILFAIGLAAALLFAGLGLGLIDPSHISVKTAYPGVILGGALLGIGFAVAGYCPGTSLAAAFTGRLDGLAFVLGGLLGTFALTLTYGWMQTTYPALFEHIAGGAVSLAQTGNEKYPALLSFGVWPGIVLGVIFMGIAAALPKAILKD